MLYLVQLAFGTFNNTNLSSAVGVAQQSLKCNVQIFHVLEGKYSSLIILCDYISLKQEKQFISLSMDVNWLLTLTHI